MRHYLIISFLVVVSLKMYSQSNTKNIQKAKTAELNLGKKLYVKYACNSCHGDDGVLEGDLRQAYKKYDDTQLTTYIKSPYKFKNFKMPVYETVILENDYKALLAYIRHLGESAEKQKK